MRKKQSEKGEFGETGYFICICKPKTTGTMLAAKKFMILLYTVQVVVTF